MKSRLVLVLALSTILLASALGKVTFSGCDEVKCFVDPCKNAECPRQPDAKCVVNNCGGCFAEFHLKGVKLEDSDCVAAKLKKP